MSACSRLDEVSCAEGCFPEKQPSGPPIILFLSFSPPGGAPGEPRDPRPPFPRPGDFLRLTPISNKQYMAWGLGSRDKMSSHPHESRASAGDEATWKHRFMDVRGQGGRERGSAEKILGVLLLIKSEGAIGALKDA